MRPPSPPWEQNCNFDFYSCTVINIEHSVPYQLYRTREAKIGTRIENKFHAVLQQCLSAP